MTKSKRIQLGFAVLVASGLVLCAMAALVQGVGKPTNLTCESQRRLIGAQELGLRFLEQTERSCTFEVGAESSIEAWLKKNNYENRGIGCGKTHTTYTYHNKTRTISVTYSDLASVTLNIPY